ncbi:unnamed protein product [Parajaminaea phylloscopi]
MSALEDFKRVVKEAIAGNKLSSSRVEAVKKAATRCFDRPQLAKAEFARLHAAAPASSKICSLYLFDAISRHAKDTVRKSGAGQDPEKALPSTSKAANPMAAYISAAREFLSEMGTVVEEIAEDTSRTVKPEQKEKIIKVIEIWKKSDTFDSKLLVALADKVRAAQASSSAQISSQGTPNAQGSARSTTPVEPPPADFLARLAKSSTVQAQGSTAEPQAMPGLPPNLAALLGNSHGQSSVPQSEASSSTQTFMNSLNSLVGNSGLQPSSKATSDPSLVSSSAPQAAPTFDLSQLTALQHLTQGQSHTDAAFGNSSRSGAGLSGEAVSSIQHSSRSRGADVAPETNSAADNLDSSWPPPPLPAEQASSAGDLSAFDPLSFDPTAPANWIALGRMWANTYGGYIPPLPELAMQFLFAHQTAVMNMNGGGGP